MMAGPSSRHCKFFSAASYFSCSAADPGKAASDSAGFAALAGFPQPEVDVPARLRTIRKTIHRRERMARSVIEVPRSTKIAVLARSKCADAISRTPELQESCGIEMDQGTAHTTTQENAAASHQGGRGVYTPRSGIFASASLNRLVKLAAQMTKVSSTICPSS